jgi:hypothetical protein
MKVQNWIRLQWDRLGAWALVLAGGLALILGWVGVSGTPYPAKELPYIISGGIGGVVLVSLGATLWLSADLRDEWRKLDGLEEELRANSAALATWSAANPAELDDTTEIEVSHNGMRSAEAHDLATSAAASPVRRKTAETHAPPLAGHDRRSPRAKRPGQPAGDTVRAGRPKRTSTK